ncbi:YncE family protein [Kitasatospora sp. MMS16-BH015]|uniref:YncE family protein n=1 Tax=Kitasatospora sp. MMS16-BH015 TaxID=2018025 RepID=UPI001C2C1149|nr:YncE family protein [Kitasatospora sp. MMS16-BH015]
MGARLLHGSVALATLAGALVASATAHAGTADLRGVVLVGNSQSGTVSFLDSRTFAVLGTFDVIPDLQQRLAEMDLIQRAGYAAVKQQEGGDRFVDDVALSPDGRILYVSRGNLDDTAAFDLTSRQELWHTRLAGFHADHAALSPDGTRWVVSATTANEAQVFDTATGAVVGSFPTGTYPHQNDFTPDGRYIYNSSIGVIMFPQALEWMKGGFQLTKVDARSLNVVQTWSFPHGIRPNVLAADGTTFYAQQSYFNGFVKYDLNSSKITDTVPMPFSPAGRALSPDNYPKNSAHHGLALSGDQSRLCDVGTIDDYTALVETTGLTTVGRVDYPAGSLPYWAVSAGPANRYCFVSLSQAGQVSVVDYASGQELARVPVGVFPQRERAAQLAGDALTALSR